MFFRLSAVILLAATLPACATLTTGTSQTVTIVTNPPGASCQLRRDNAVIGTVSTTPGTVEVSKSSRAIAVSCTRPGHNDSTGTLGAEFQAMTLGNVLIGGLIGVIVDASSGASSSYPTTITMSLVPIEGPSELQRIDDQIAALRQNCAPRERQRCNQAIRDLERERVRVATPTS